jgi:hypothetical protein
VKTSNLTYPVLVRGVIWRVLTNGAAAAFAQHEPNQAFMGHGRGPFTPKIQHLQIPGSCERLSRWHGSTSLQRSSVHLWYRCHIDLLHFAVLEGVIHDTRYLSHDFWYFSVYDQRYIFGHQFVTENKLISSGNNIILFKPVGNTV